MTKLLSANHDPEHFKILPSVDAPNMFIQSFNRGSTALASNGSEWNGSETEKELVPMRRIKTQRKVCDTPIYGYFSTIVLEQVCIEYVQYILVDEYLHSSPDKCTA